MRSINGVFSDMDVRDFKRNTAYPLNHFSRENIERLYMINSKDEDEGDAKIH